MLTPQDFRPGSLWVSVRVGKVMSQGREAGRLEREQVSERPDQSNISDGSGLVSSGRRKHPSDGPVPDMGAGPERWCGAEPAALEGILDHRTCKEASCEPHL